MPNDCSTFFLVLHHPLLLCPSRHLYQMNYLQHCCVCYLLVIEVKVEQLELKTIGLYYQALKEEGSFLCEFMLFVLLKVFVSALWLLAPTFFFEYHFPTIHFVAIDVNQSQFELYFKLLWVFLLLFASHLLAVQFPPWVASFSSPLVLLHLLLMWAAMFVHQVGFIGFSPHVLLSFFLLRPQLIIIASLF